MFEYIRHTLDQTSTSSVLLQSKYHFLSLLSKNIPKHSVISIEIKQKHRRNLKIDTNEDSNILVSKSCYERISKYICIKILIQTNIRINIRIENIRIYEYIRHTLD